MDLNPEQPIALVYLLGGQTEHWCGLRELGVCSDEVWVLRLDLAGYRDGYAQPQHIAKYSWTTEAGSPAFRLPFSRRCGAAVYQDYSVRWAVAVGGQLSYSDPSCSSLPQPLNDVWIQRTGGLQRNFSDWSQDADAPFSPRRDQQREDVLRRRGPTGSTMLVGGMRILNLTQTRITALEVMADAWACDLIYINDSARRCDWALAQDEQPAAPTARTSLPLPTAGGADAVIRGAWPLAGQRFGGFTAQAAVQDWLDAAPLLTDSMLAAGSGATPSTPLVNATALLRPVLLYPLSPAEIRSQRLGLPLSYIMTDDEINAAAGSYQTGSQWIQSHAPWIAGEALTEGPTAAIQLQPSASPSPFPAPLAVPHSTRQPAMDALRGHLAAQPLSASVRAASPRPPSQRLDQPPDQFHHRRDHRQRRSHRRAVSQRLDQHARGPLSASGRPKLRTAARLSQRPVVCLTPVLCQRRFLRSERPAQGRLC